LDGVLCFEFIIPRIGKRADNVLLIGDQVIVIEFKIGSDAYDHAAKNQVVDYALDLRNFHQGSHAAIITPILVSTRAPLRVNDHAEPYDGVFPVFLANSQSIADIISQSTARAGQPRLPHRAWLESGYRPTPTIVEAAQALYHGHRVSDITHSEAGADNLSSTTQAISRIIDHARLTAMAFSNANFLPCRVRPGLRQR